MAERNAPDEGAFSFVAGKTREELRKEIQAREYLVARNLIEGQRRAADLWTGAFVYGIHRDVFGRHFPEAAGRNRTGELIFGRRAAPPPEQLDALMSQIIDGIRSHVEQASRIERGAAWLDQIFLWAAADHGEMIRVHPFVDGNGRWARIVTNAFLFDCGLPTGAIVRRGQKRAYIAALDRWIDNSEAGDLRNVLLAGYNDAMRQRRAARR